MEIDPRDVRQRRARRDDDAGSGIGDEAVVQHDRRFEPQPRQRPPADPKIQREDPPVADIGRGLKAGQVDDIGLDVRPARIGESGGEVEATAARQAVAQPRLERRDPVILEPSDRGEAGRTGRVRRFEGDDLASHQSGDKRRSNREAARPKALLVAREEQQIVGRPRRERRGRKEHRFIAGRTQLTQHGQHRHGRIEHASGQARMGEAAAQRRGDALRDREGALPECRELVHAVAHPGDRERRVRVAERARDFGPVRNEAGADQPARPAPSRSRQAAFGGQQCQPVGLMVDGRRPTGPGGVITLVERLMDDARRGHETKAIAPIVLHNDIAEQVIVRITFRHRAGAGERRRIAVRELAVRATDALAGDAEFDGPVARLRAQPRAAAMDGGAIDVVQTAQRVVDIAALARAISHDAQGERIGNDRHIQHRSRLAARIAMLGESRADRHRSLNPVHARRIGHDAQDTTERAGAVERALRPRQHFDPVDIVEMQIRIGRIVVQPRLAEILADRRLGRAVEARIGDAPNEQLVAAGAEMGRIEPGERGHKAFGPAPVCRSHWIVAVGEDHRARKGCEPEAALGRGNNDVRLLDLGQGRRRRSRRAPDPRRIGTALRCADHAPGAAVDRHGVRPGAARQTLQRGGNGHPAAHRTHPACGQRRIGNPDADARLLAEHHQRIPKATGREIELVARRGFGRSSADQDRRGQDQARAAHRAPPPAASPRHRAGH